MSGEHEHCPVCGDDMCKNPNHEGNIMTDTITLDQIQTPTDERYVVQHRASCCVVSFDSRWPEWFIENTRAIVAKPSSYTVLGPVSSLQSSTLDEQDDALPEEDDTPPEPDLSDWPGWEAVAYRRAIQGEPYWGMNNRPHVCEAEQTGFWHWVLRYTPLDQAEEPPIPPEAEAAANEVGWTIERRATSEDEGQDMLHFYWIIDLEKWNVSTRKPDAGDYICRPITTEPK